MEEKFRIESIKPAEDKLYYHVDSQQMVAIERANINPIIQNQNINHSYELKEGDINIYNEIEIEYGINDSRDTHKHTFQLQQSTHYEMNQHINIH